VKKGKYQRHNLVKHWLAHLAGHLGGQPLTTLIVSKAGNVRFEPLEPDDARAQVDTLLATWQDGMARRCRWRSRPPSRGSTAQRQGAYEGGYMLTGEVESSPYLRRAWPSFDALTASGEFARLAEACCARCSPPPLSNRPARAAAPAGDQA
jgi:exodeoxyribonuclease V gamma subunit